MNTLINYSERFDQLQQWLKHTINYSNKLDLLTGDASFRRYYRIIIDHQNYIVMDAPPPYENCQSYIDIAEQLRLTGVLVPEILKYDLNQGFLLLSDFGDNLLLNELSTTSAKNLYGQAFNSLLKIQNNSANTYHWPSFDQAQYYREFELFTHWFLEQFHQLKLTTHTQIMLEDTFKYLTESAMLQPQVCVHRDYHSRNLMILNDKSLGILDFQDALWGPVTYDVVSLLKDCYIDWPIDQVRNFALQYQRLALTANILTVDNFHQFWCWLDWMGLQRHLKCLGIFSRLYLLYKKPNYLQYIPRTLHYAQEVAGRYPEFKKLSTLLCNLPQ